MIYRLLVAASLLGLSEQVSGPVFDGCGCGGPYPTYTLTGNNYCSTTYGSCDLATMVEENCMLTCPSTPNKRTQLIYRNLSSTQWLMSSSYLKCEDGQLINSEGKVVTPTQVTMLRPNCGVKQKCNTCPYTEELDTCPDGQTCNPANLVHEIAEDGCDRVSCLNSAKLTLYNSTTKEVMDYTTSKLFCTIANKWSNNSNDGNTAGGSPISGTFSVNCRLPATCEACIAPKFITDDSQLPVEFRAATGNYIRQTPTVTKTPGVCSTAKCQPGFRMMGFVGADANQSQEALNQNFLKCNSQGLWANGGYTAIPQPMYVTCLQKKSVCPPVDFVLGEPQFTITCDETTKVNSLTCPAGKKLSMRYQDVASNTKYDRATFFAGKGWLAHGCDATAALFTQANGKDIQGACS